MNGNIYQGMFSDGKKNGEGKMIYTNLKNKEEDSNDNN
jgi:hypothetical protein